MASYISHFGKLHICVRMCRKIPTSMFMKAACVSGLLYISHFVCAFSLQCVLLFNVSICQVYKNKAIEEYSQR